MKKTTRRLFAFCLLPAAYCLLAFSAPLHASGICAGFFPQPCAPTGRAPRPTLPNYPTNVDGNWTDGGPEVGVPFINYFGEREVRVTDAMHPGGVDIGTTWGGVRNPDVNIFSLYDPSINGYWFITYDAYTRPYMYQLDPRTMQVRNYCPASWAACEVPYASSWSFQTPGLMYYASGSDICSYNYDTSSGSGTCSDSVGTLIYSFANCPGWSAAGGDNIYNALPNHSDTVFASESGNNFEVAVYNKTANKCYWFNSQTGLVGGTDNPNGVMNSGPWPTAPTMPANALTATTGSLPSGTYYVEETEQTDPYCRTSGGATIECETLPSNEESITLASAGGISIASPTLNSGIIDTRSYEGCNVYVGTSSGGETLQLRGQSCSAAISFGPSSLASGAAPPTVNQGGVNLHSADLSAAGNWYEISSSEQTGSGVFFWNVFGSTGTETTTMSFCKLVGACGGHIGLGGSELLYDTQGGVNAMVNVFPLFDQRLASYSNVSSSGSTTVLVPSGPPYYEPWLFPQYDCNSDDQHSTWTYDNADDTMPVAFSTVWDSSAPRHGWSVEYINCAWDHEIDAVAADTSGTTWRFAHDRADGRANKLSGPGTNYPAEVLVDCSPDGHYCMFATDWNQELGTATENNSPTSAGCQYGCKWLPSTSYTTNYEIVDSNGNEERASTGGVTGATQPTWPTTAGNTVTDGGVTWQMEPGCNTPQDVAVIEVNGGLVPNDGGCRTDVFIVEMR